MRTIKLLISLCLFIFTIQLHAQMFNGVDTLYGNEWIDYEKDHLTIQLAEDGIYKIDYNQIAFSGFEESLLKGSDLVLFKNGIQVPIYVSTEAFFSQGDYIEFYGTKNRAELDQYLYKDPAKELLNPNYNTVTDTSTYYLVANPEVAKERYENVANDFSNLPAPELYYMEQEDITFSNSYNRIRINAQGVHYSTYDEGEGFAFGWQHLQYLDFNPTNIYEGDVNGIVEARWVGWEDDHQHTLSVNNTVYYDTSFQDVKVIQANFELPNSQIKDLTRVIIEGKYNAEDLFNVSTSQLSYPRKFDFNGANHFEFNVQASSSRKYIEIENFNSTAGTPVVYDVSNAKKIIAQNEAGIIKLVLPPSTIDRKLVLINDSNGAKLADTELKTFENYTNGEAEYIIITHPLLRSDVNGVDWVKNYADYRSSAEGGSFTTSIFDIDQIYDQFGYGIERHPQGLKNFGAFIAKNWDETKMVFIIGKSVEFFYVRSETQIQQHLHKSLFIPTFGSPGSDMLLFGKFENATPPYPIGRIAAISPDNVRIYLDKAKAHARSQREGDQTLEDKTWLKEIVHLSGGGGANEQERLFGHLEVMRDTIENSLYGARVSTYRKTATATVTSSQSAELTEKLNNGVSIVKFLGHSSAHTFDFAINDPDELLNKDKYFYLSAMGCFAGLIHGRNRSLSERYIFSEESGAVAFLASSAQGYEYSLRTFGIAFYNLLGNEMYGSYLGDIIKTNVFKLEENGSPIFKLLAQQMTLHGDPALVLGINEGPDFVIDNQTVQIEPQNLNANLDSFQLCFDIVNIGNRIHGDLAFKVNQKIPNGELFDLKSSSVKAPSYIGNVCLNVPMLKEDVAGINQLYIELDHENKIAEFPNPAAENNNKLYSSFGIEGLDFFISSNNIRPTFPTNFAIVNDANLKLFASTSDPFAPLNTYLFEIDTTEKFNSPLKQDYQTQQLGGIIEWTPNINLLEDQVYYWRTGVDSIDQNGYNWRNHSFIYMPEASPGWNQSHYFQHLKNDFDNLSLPEETRKNSYAEYLSDLTVLNGVYDGEFRPELNVNNIPTRYIPSDGPVEGGVYIAVLDPVSLKTLNNDHPGLYGSIIPSWLGVGFTAFPFNTQTLEDRENVINFLNDIVPDGHYVVLFTIQTKDGLDYRPELWLDDSWTIGTNLFKVLEDQGASLIKSTIDVGALPYSVVFKKNDPSFTPVESIGSLTESNTINLSLTTRWFKGSINSQVIGPAYNWQYFEWELGAYDQVNDTISYDIIGLDANQTETVLFENQLGQTLDLTSVSASEYPYLKLVFHSKDELDRTSPNLNYWRVFYDGLTDLAINPNDQFIFESDTIIKGESLKLEYSIANLGPLDVDSVLVKYTIRDQNNQAISETLGYGAVIANESITGTYSRGTDDLQGDYYLSIIINPDNMPSENYRFNNIGQLNFHVLGDNINPLLDVTFDGIHIIDRDIVSAMPVIRIELADENEFLALSDTSLFDIMLQYPIESDPRPVNFSDLDVIFYPASGDLSEENKAAVEINRTFELDGIYTLIVQAKDASGNVSGDLSYKVAFEIITKSMVSRVMNYPNPFSTATRFVYTLTGSQIPDVFTIQIMTVSGKMVRQIEKHELGEIKMGTHMTDYVWDGSDDYGDKLAPGVYIYRVLIWNDDGDQIELFESKADNYFKEGYGKMVLLR